MKQVKMANGDVVDVEQGDDDTSLIQSHVIAPHGLYCPDADGWVEKSDLPDGYLDGDCPVCGEVLDG